MARLLPAAVTGLALLCAAPTQADPYQFLGFGRLFSNDLFGDGYNRWQSSGTHGSFAFSAHPWTGQLPRQPGEVVELRLNALIITPDHLRHPSDGDRPMAGVIRLGFATQYQRYGWENDFAAYAEYAGPDSGIVDLFTGFQDLSPQWTTPSKEVRDAQIDVPLQLGVSLESGRSFDVPGARLRPFWSLDTGLETLARIGADLTIGSFGQGALLTRDRVTGQRFSVVDGQGDGVSFVLGGDVTWVEQSQLLPEDQGTSARAQRNRLRTGVHWQSGARHVFYGATWLSPESEAQDTGQTVGSLRLTWSF